MKRNETTMKTFRVKKDTHLYHPTPIILLKGSKLKVEKGLLSIIFSVDNMIITDPKIFKEHFEEVDDNET